MDFVVVVGLFGLFVAGMGLAFQGFVGKEINPEGTPFGFTPDPNNPGIQHPPVRHRGRMMLIGVGLMTLAVVIGILVL